MLFSMLHYSISQSNNSIFVHQRILSCLIVYYSLLPPYLLEPPLPPLLPSSASLMCSNHGDVSPLDSVRSGLEVKEPTRTSSFQKCKRMKSLCVCRGTDDYETRDPMQWGRTEHYDVLVCPWGPVPWVHRFFYRVNLFCNPGLGQRDFAQEQQGLATAK